MSDSSIVGILWPWLCGGGKRVASGHEVEEVLVRWGAGWMDKSKIEREVTPERNGVDEPNQYFWTIARPRRFFADPRPGCLSAYGKYNWILSCRKNWYARDVCDRSSIWWYWRPWIDMDEGQAV
ncbi:hypothetical protein B0H16DRAFT_1467081 [Mycena metata]|uniref:Uncharacterized protein n=1 Tax=Mycena metata TaxID=1033252 RepID=A0AAD7I6P0_9AGAR|nr:hypothetical protein B0H16DRAFT_1467081 [Mycena metata]